eukprot:gb/GECH01010040.1/.p1 GENE.gb/GECH01010040.1/~~gb/GECH01010040.1/.p1  ORF type:complete len:284 (+),score=29.41 gb/GECH01010040.1/:1-852(+)
MADSIEPPFQNREGAIEETGKSIYNSAYALCKDPSATRNNGIDILSQFYGAGKSRFLKELRKKIPSIADTIRKYFEKRDILSEEILELVRNARYLHLVVPSRQKSQEDYSFNPLLLKKLAIKLQVKNGSLKEVFLEYIKKQNISENEKELLVISLDEFNLTNLYCCPSSKENIIEPWTEVLSVSSEMALEGLLIKWIWSGKEISFQKIKGNMSHISPSTTHWIMLECLNKNHIHQIIISTFSELYSKLEENGIKELFLDKLTGFTSLLYLLIYLLFETRISFL